MRPCRGRCWPRCARARAPLRQWLLSPLAGRTGDGARRAVDRGGGTAAARPRPRGSARARGVRRRRRSAPRSAMASAGRWRAARRRQRYTSAARWCSMSRRAHGRARAARAGPCRRARGASRWPASALAPEDEVKHFKLIGTTGTGKSTAIRELLARGARARRPRRHRRSGRRLPAPLLRCAARRCDPQSLRGAPRPDGTCSPRSAMTTTSSSWRAR